MRRGKRHSEAGVSLIEAAIAMLIFSVAAVAVFPAFYQGTRTMKEGQFSDVCNSAIRAKMNQYRFGAQTTTTNAALSSEAGLTPTTNTGFTYAKERYNALPPTVAFTYCPTDTSVSTTYPRSVTTMPPTSINHLGHRECVGGLGTGGPDPATINCSAYSLDTQIRNTAPNFKVFVNLRRYNPVTGAENCPWHAGTSSWDFQHAEDMIKITITGLIDFTEPGARFGEVTAAHPKASQFYCQISDYIRPQPQPARYWMKSDGKIYRWQATGAMTDNYWVFRNTANAANIGFTVSPDNKFIYILRSGSVLRYTNCSGDPIDCTTNDKTWTVSATLRSISGMWTLLPGQTEHKPNPVCGTPNFQNGYPILFGITTPANVPVCLDTQHESASTSLTLQTDGNPRLSDGVTAYIPFTVPAVAGRVQSIFTDSAATSAYVLDTTCTNSNYQFNE